MQICEYEFPIVQISLLDLFRTVRGVDDLF